MNINLCYYKNIFGKPNEGLHKYRMFNIAIIDLGLTILAAYLLAKYYNQNFAIVLFLLLLLGIVMHHIFCVKTTVDKLLFGN